MCECVCECVCVGVSVCVSVCVCVCNMKLIRDDIGIDCKMNAIYTEDELRRKRKTSKI